VSMIEEIQTRHGLARFHIDERRAATVLMLGHGAGGGVESADLAHLAASLTDINVIRFEQPWRVAGKRIAPSPRILDESWLDAVSAFMNGRPKQRLIVGGRSAGARVACRTAEELGACGVLALAFPLHPPGKPERSRANELLGVEVPLIVVQGSRDPFGRPAEFPSVDVEVIPNAGHELGAVEGLSIAFARLLPLICG
jgi:uncharacterized protein